MAKVILAISLLIIPPSSFGQSDFWIFSGFPDTYISGVGSHPFGRIFAWQGWPGDGFLYQSSDWGENWVQTSTHGYGTKAFLADQSGMLFVAGEEFHRSSDGGVTWETITEVFEASATSLVADQNNFLLVGHEAYVDPPGFSGGGIYRSTDNGSTWELLGFDREFISAIAVTPEGDILLSNAYSSSLYQSTDDGVSWGYVINGPYASALLSTLDGKIIAGTNSGIFCSTDRGDTWFQTLSDEVEIHSFAYHPEGKILAAAGTGRIYLSEDGGESWERTDSGIGDRDVVGVAFDSRGFGIAATDSGVFRSSDRITDVHRNSVLLPDQLLMSQNYPNPFNPSTTIRFDIPGSGEVSLKLFNLLGEEVVMLISGHRDAGTHIVTWDATGHPSGVYFYRLLAGDFVETRKLVLVR